MISLVTLDIILLGARVTADLKDTLLVSESLKGVVDESQFYDDAYDKKSTTTLYFSDENNSINIDLDSLDINNTDSTLKISFECNSHLSGRISEGSFKKIEINFMGYILSREIEELKNINVLFSSIDLCTMTLTFGFIDPI